MTFTAVWTLSQQQFEVHQVAGFANSALQCNAYFVNVGYDVILAAKVAIRTPSHMKRRELTPAGMIAIVNKYLISKKCPFSREI